MRSIPSNLACPFFWKLNTDWTLFALPSVSFSLENGANLWESMSGGTILGASYQWTDRLAIGPGFGVFSQIEDDASLFPLIYLDWQLSDNLNLTTRPSGAIVSGPGLLLNWTISDQWSATIGVNYEKARFRIEGSSAAARNGVGEYRGIPIFTGISFQPGEHVRFNAFAGVRFANELRLENSSGATLIQRDSDPAPFFGAGVSLDF